MSPLPEEERNVVTCTLCTTIVNDIGALLENGTVTDEQIIDYIINTCVTLNIFANPDQVCGGMAAIALVYAINPHIFYLHFIANSRITVNSRLSNTSSVLELSIRVTFVACFCKDNFVNYPTLIPWSGRFNRALYLSPPSINQLCHRYFSFIHLSQWNKFKHFIVLSFDGKVLQIT